LSFETDKGPQGHKKKKKKKKKKGGNLFTLRIGVPLDYQRVFSEKGSAEKERGSWVEGWWLLGSQEKGGRRDEELVSRPIDGTGETTINKRWEEGT